MNERYICMNEMFKKSKKKPKKKKKNFIYFYYFILFSLSIAVIELVGYRFGFDAKWYEVNASKIYPAASIISDFIVHTFRVSSTFYCPHTQYVPYAWIFFYIFPFYFYITFTIIHFPSIGLVSVWIAFRSIAMNILNIIVCFGENHERKAKKIAILQTPS